MAQFFYSSPFSNIKKSILTNLKIPGTVFLLIPFFIYSKKHTYESQNALHNFLLIPFFKYSKKHTYESQNTWHSFCAHPLFQILQKEYLRISKHPFNTNNNNFKGNNLHKNHCTNQ